MKVRDCMNFDTVSVSKNDDLRTVVAKMIMHNCSAVMVTDGGGKLIGIVTVRDTMLPLYPDQGDYVHDSIHARDFEAMEEGYAKVMSMKAGDVMTANPVTVSVDDPVLKAASFMGLRNLRRIPVTNDGTLVGVVSIENINSALFMSVC